MPGQLFIHPFIKVQINNLPISKLFCAREGPNGFLLIPTICTNYKAKSENGDLDFSSFPRYVQSKRWKPGTPRWENFFREPLDSCQVIMLPETNFWKTAKDSCALYHLQKHPRLIKSMVEKIFPPFFDNCRRLNLNLGFSPGSHLPGPGHHQPHRRDIPLRLPNSLLRCAIWWKIALYFIRAHILNKIVGETHIWQKQRGQPISHWAACTSIDAHLKSPS